MGRRGNIDENVIPAGRTGGEEDAAGALLYMASRAGAYLNGSVIVVDGGRWGGDLNIVTRDTSFSRHTATLASGVMFW